MKKWYKLSLTSLIIPTAGGVTLTAVGCGVFDNNTDVYVPEMVAGINLIGGNENDPATWWNNTFKTPETRLNALNKYLTQDTQLSTVEAQDAFVTGLANNTKIQFKVKLNENYEFSNINSSEWTSPEIDYQGPINKATAFQTLTDVYANAQNLNDWARSISQQSDPKVLVPYLFTSYPNLNALSNIRINSLTTNKLVNATGTQNFTVTIQLKDSFVFTDQTNVFMTPTNKPIVYHGGIQESLNNPISITNQIKGPSATVVEWFNTLGKTPIEKFNAIFEADTKINATNLVGVYLTQVNGNKFAIEVVIKDNYFISTKTNVITLSGFTYTATSSIKKPELTNTSVNVYSKAVDVNAWWKTLNNTTAQINTINSWFKSGSDLNAIASSIASISLLPNQQDQNKWDLTIKLVNGQIFSDSKNFASFTITINYERLNVSLPNPELKTGTIDQNGEQQTLKAWWDSFNKDLTKEVNAINSWFNAGKDLSSIKDDINSITLDIDSQNPTKVNLTIKLNPYFVFAGNNKDTLTLSGNVKYTKNAQKVGPQPTLTSKSLSVTTSITDVNTWWSSFKGVVNNQVDAIKGWFNNDALTKIKANIASINLVASTSDKNKWDLTIALNSGSIFNDGSKSATFAGLTITLQPIKVTDPKLINQEISVTGDEADTQTWVDAFNKKPLSDRITSTNYWLENATKLDPSKNNVEKIEFVPNADKWNLTITLKPGYSFSNNKNKIELPVTINFKQNPKKVSQDPVLNTSTIVVNSSEPTIEAWVTAFNDQPALDKIATVDAWLKPETKLDSYQNHIDTITVNKNGDKYDLIINLKDNYIFSTGNNSITLSITSITYNVLVKNPKLNSETISAKGDGTLADWIKDFNKAPVDENKINEVNGWLTTDTVLNVNLKDHIISIMFNTEISANNLVITLKDNYQFADGLKTASLKVTIDFNQNPIPVLHDPELNSGTVTIGGSELTLNAWMDAFTKKPIKEKIDIVNKWLKPGANFDSYINFIDTITLTQKDGKYELGITLKGNHVFSDGQPSKTLTITTITYNVLVKNPIFQNNTITIKADGVLADWIKDFNNQQVDENKINEVNKWLTAATALSVNLKDHIASIIFNTQVAANNLVITLKGNYLFADNSKNIASLPIKINYIQNPIQVDHDPELKSEAITINGNEPTLNDWINNVFNAKKVDENIPTVNQWLKEGTQLDSFSQFISSISLKQNGNKYDLVITLKDNHVFKDGRDTKALPITITYNVLVKNPVIASGTITIHADGTLETWINNFNNAPVDAAKASQVSLFDLINIINHVASINFKSTDKNNTLVITLKENDHYLFADSLTKTASVSVVIDYIQNAIKVDHDPELIADSITINSSEQTLKEWVANFNGKGNEEKIAIVDKWLKPNGNLDSYKNFIGIISLTPDGNKYDLAISLKDNHVFNDNQVTKILPITINYNVLVKNPQLNGNTIDIKNSGLLSDWIKQFNSTPADATKIKQVNQWLKSDANLDAFSKHINSIEFNTNSASNNLVITLKDNYLFNDGQSNTTSLPVTINYSTIVNDPEFRTDSITINSAELTLDAWAKTFNAKSLQEKIDLVNTWLKSGSNLNAFEKHIDVINMTVNGSECSLDISLKDNYIFISNNQAKITLTINISYNVQVKNPVLRSRSITVQSQETLAEWIIKFNNAPVDQTKINQVNQWLRPDANLNAFSKHIASIMFNTSNPVNNLVISLGDNYLFVDGNQKSTTLALTINYRVIVKDPELITNNISISGNEASVGNWVNNFNAKFTTEKVTIVNKWLKPDANLTSFSQFIDAISLAPNGNNNYSLAISLKDNHIFSDGQTFKKYTVSFDYTVLVKSPQLLNQTIEVNGDGVLSDWIKQFNGTAVDANKIIQVNKWLRPSANLDNFKDHIASISFKDSSENNTLVITLKDKDNYLFSDGTKTTSLSVTIKFKQNPIKVHDPELNSITIAVKSSEPTVDEWVDAFNVKPKQDKIDLVNTWLKPDANLTSFSQFIDAISLTSSGNNYNLAIHLTGNHVFSDGQATKTLTLTINYTVVVKNPQLLSPTISVRADGVLSDWITKFNGTAVDTSKIQQVNAWLQPGANLDAFSNHLDTITFKDSGENNTLFIKIKDNYQFADGSQTASLSVIIKFIQNPIKVDHDPELKDTSITINSSEQNLSEWVKNFNTKQNDQKIAIVNEWLKPTANLNSFSTHIASISLTANETNKADLMITLKDNYIFNRTQDPSDTWSINIIYNVLVKNPQLNDKIINVSGTVSLVEWIQQFNHATLDDTKINQVNTWLKSDSNLSAFSKHLDSINFSGNGQTNNLVITLKDNYLFTDGQSKTASLPVTINYSTIVKEPTLVNNQITINSSETTLNEWVKNFNQQGISARITAVNAWLTPETSLNPISDHVNNITLTLNGDHYDLAITLKDNYFFTGNNPTKTLSLTINYNVLVKKPQLLKNTINVSGSSSLMDWIKQFNANSPDTNKIKQVNEWLQPNANLDTFNTHIDAITFSGDGTTNNLIITLKDNYLFAEGTTKKASLPVTINYSTVVKDPAFTNNEITINSSEVNIDGWLNTFKGKPNSEKINLVNQWLKPDANLNAISDHIDTIAITPSKDGKYNLMITLKDNFLFTTGKSISLPFSINYNVLVKSPQLKQKTLNVKSSGTLLNWIKQFNASPVDTNKINQVNDWLQSGSNLDTFRDHIDTIKFSTDTTVNNLVITLKDNYLFDDASQSKTVSLSVNINYMTIVNDPGLTKNDIQINSSETSLGDWVNAFNAKELPNKIDLVNTWLKPETNFNAYRSHISGINLKPNGDKYNLNITLKDNYIFSSTGNETISLPITINYNILVKNPVFANSSITITSKLTLAEWIKQFNDAPTDQNKINQVNPWLKPDANLDAFRDHIDTIKFSTDTTVNNLVITLKDNYLFADSSTKVASLTITIDFIKQTYVNKPNIAEDIWKIASPANDVLGWWDSLKDTPGRIEAINGYFMSGYDLKSIQNYIDTMALKKSDDSNPNGWNLFVNLKPNTFFANTNENTYKKYLEIHFSHQSFIDAPVLIDGVKQMTSPNADNVQQWWDNFNKDKNAEINAINDWFQPNNSLDKIRDKISTITLTDYGVVNVYNLTINLIDNTFFSDSKKASVTFTPTITFIKTTYVTQPSLGYSTHVAHTKNIAEWWKNLGTTEERINQTTSWFKSREGLIDIKNAISDLELVPDSGDEWTLTVILKFGYLFYSDKNTYTLNIAIVAQGF